MSHQPKRVKVVLFVAMLIMPMLAGCSQSMALKPDTKSLDTQKKSIAIFTLVVKNDYKPYFGAAPIWMHVKSKQSGDIAFQLDGDWQGEGTRWLPYWTRVSEFPVSLSLKPGSYTIGDIRGLGTNIGLSWTFEFPLNAELNLPPGSIVYLGHVVMTNRERKGDEPRSGSIFPLIDQAAAGYSGGTMDISVTDESSLDIPKFLEKYPCLKGISIKTAIMTKP